MMNHALVQHVIMQLFGPFSMKLGHSSYVPTDIFVQLYVPVSKLGYSGLNPEHGLIP